MMKFGILFALVAAAVADPIPRLDQLNPTSRIGRGVTIPIDEAPYQASVQFQKIFHVCGGTIISDSWILTAAHCVIWPLSWYTTRTGTTIAIDGGTVTSTAAIVSHTGYTSNAWGVPANNLALIRLSSPLTFGSTQAPAALFLPGQESVAGTPVNVTGWTEIEVEETDMQVLQSVTLPIASKAECNAAYSAWGGISDGLICVGVVQEGGLNSCQDDAGGPVTIDGVVAGVVALSFGCISRPEFPTIYTEVAAYRDWITANSGVQ